MPKHSAHQRRLAMARTIRLARFAAEGFLKFVEVATARHPLPGHLPRQTWRYEPNDSACPDCGGMLRKLSVGVSERTEYVPASFFVVRPVWPKTVIRIVNERLYFSAHNRKRDG